MSAPRCPECIDHPGWATADETCRRDPLDTCRACFGSGVDQRPRTYAVGVPLVVNVHPDGRVTFEVDLSEVEVDEDDDAALRYPGPVVMLDALTVSEATATLNHTHSFNA